LQNRTARSQRPIRVLHVAAEIFPFVKTGGLADVVGSLPRALARSGCDLRLLLPGFAPILDALKNPRKIGEFGPLFGAGQIRLLQGTLDDSAIKVIVIDSPWLYRRSGGPYLDEQGHEWPDNLQRFALLGWVAAHLASGEFTPNWLADVIHAHDWHAALACCYLKAHPTIRARSVLTVHNLAYQGVFPVQDFSQLGLPRHYAEPFGELEFHGELSFMKGGLMSATHITTVSPSYAREITTPKFGCRMEGVLAQRADAMSGILNGIDTEVWNPSTDREIAARFSTDDLSGKRECKLALQSEFGLTPKADAPLIGVVSRLSAQKGLDLLRDALAQIVQSGMQLVLLGSGEPDIQADFRAAAAAHPKQIGVQIGYDEKLAHRIIAGADLIAVPSRFEPCGLTQLYGMRYGTLPLVRRVGGLADTVDAETGFSFIEPQTSLANTLQTALETYRNAPARWQAMMQAAMRRDFGWDTAARQYMALYSRLCERAAAP